MESVVIWLCEHAEHAPLLIFWLLVLAGFSLPLSEDILVIASGVLASTVIPERTVVLFLAALLGSFVSDIIAYAIGRFFRERIHGMKWFKSRQNTVDKVKVFYKKYGIWALVIGRCIPFGFRNGIFMTAGAAKMRFATFFISDAISCTLFSGTLFFLAYSFGANFELLYTYVFQAGLIVAALVALAIGGYSIVSWRKRKAVRVS